MKKTLVASYCGACGEVCLSYQEPEDGDGVGDLVNCPNCLTDIGGNAGGAWNEVDLPVEDQLRFEQLTRQAQPPFQRVVNHEPEHARRIASLEEQIKELREFLGMNLVNSVSDRLKKELKVEERLGAVEALMTEWEWESCVNEVTELKKRVEKVHADADKWTGNLHDVCVRLEERVKKVETEGVGYKAVVTRDPELQNQFTRLEKKIEPLQGWMNEVAEKFKKLEGWKADARVNMLEGEVGGAAEERAELAGRVTGAEKQLDLHQESLDGLYQDTAAWTHRLDQLEKHFNAYVVAGAQDPLIDPDRLVSVLADTELWKDMAKEEREQTERLKTIRENLDCAIRHFTGMIEARGQDHHERLRQVEKRVDLLVNKLPMKGAAAATDHVNAVAQEVRKLNQRLVEVENQSNSLWSGVMGDDVLTNDGSLLSRVDGLNQRICRIEEKKTSVPMSVLKDLRVLKERVEDLAKTPDLETELRTKLSQHLKQSDSGYEELQRRVSHLEPRVSKLEERRPLFDELVVRVDAAEEQWKVAQSRINNAVDVLGGHTLRIQHLEAEASHEEMQKRYKGQEERLHAVEAKVQDMWSDVMGEGEGGDDSNCTMLGIIDGVNTRASAHKALFSQHVERCHDFEVDIRDRIQKLDDRLVDVEPNGEAIETLGAYLDEQLKGLRQDLADLECRAIRVGAVEEAHGALAAQFERLVTKLDQYPEITMEASAKAREVTSRVSKLETMVAEHLLARVEGDDKLTNRLDGVELRVANGETAIAEYRRDLRKVEALAKRADEEEFAQGAVEGFTARFEEVDQQIKQLQETRASARQVSNLADRIIGLEQRMKE